MQLDGPNQSIHSRGPSAGRNRGRKERDRREEGVRRKSSKRVRSSLRVTFSVPFHCLCEYITGNWLSNREGPHKICSLIITVIMGPFLFPPCVLVQKHLKVSCVLNNDGAAACLPLARMFCFWNTKWQPTISLHPSLIKALPCWVFLWLDQSFDLCCQVTFPDPTGASRGGTLAGAPGNYLDSSVVGGCHRALVFLMSPLTPASVAIAREIWRPCWAVNNRIHLPVCDQRCHLCSPWWNVPMLIFRGDVFFLSVPGYKGRRQWRTAGESCRQGGSAGSAQGSRGAESCLKWRVKDAGGWQGTAGEAEDSSLSELWTAVNSERHQLMFSVFASPICSITKPP